MADNRNERCATHIEPGRSIRIVPEANEEQLIVTHDPMNEMQLVDYQEHRWEVIQWLREIGKHPEKREGYSDDSVYETGYRTARFDRWVWSEEDRYTIPPRPAHADQYMDDVVAFRDLTSNTKGKIEEALMRYFRWAAEKTHVSEWNRDDGSPPVVVTAPETF